MTKRLLLASVLFLATLLLRPILAAAPDPALPKCPPDWKVEVVARPPQLIHPSTVCVAPDGRVFVAQDPIDMGRPSNAAEDSILCIHPDGRITKFADNLHAVFGLAYVDGKLFVHHTPLFSVFTDDNGLGKERVDLFTTNPDPNGGGRGFNDHIPSNMRLAMDGYFYMSTGDKGIYGAIGRDGSKVNLEGGGLMRFRPDGTQLEIYSAGTRNHLDVAMNAEDEMFTYDNTDDGNGWWTRVTHMVDGGRYGYPYDYKPRRPYTLWMMTDYGGGSPTGAIAYNEDALPEEYQGNLFLCEWGRRQLLRLKISREGASYKIDSRENFLTAGSEEFRPAGIAISADGLSLYIADWNVSGWKKPDVAGRLLKVTYIGASNAKPKPAWWIPAGTGKSFQASTDELIEGIGHPAQNVRLVAQRRLAERGSEAPAKLVALLKNSAAPAMARVHALWTLDALDQGAGARGEIISLLSGSKDTVRAQAIRQLGTRRVRAAISPLRALLSDTNAAIRFQAATALGRIGDSAAVPQLVPALDEADLFTRYAVFTALNRIGRSDSFAWPEMVKGLNNANPAIREGVQFAMRETFDEANAKALAEFTASPQNSPEGRAAATTILAELHRARPAWTGRWWGTQPVKSPPPPKTVEWAGTPIVQAAVRASLRDANAIVRRAAVAGVEVSKDENSAGELLEAFARENEVENQRAILHALGSLKETKASSLLSSLLGQPREHASVLPEAIAAAGKIGGTALAGTLNELLNRMNKESLSSGTVPNAATVNTAWTTLRPAVIEALGNTKAIEAVAPLTDLLKHSDPQTRSVVTAALERIGGSYVKNALLPLLNDRDLEIRRASIGVLGSLKDKQLIPELMKAYENGVTREAALLALARTPDASAIEVFLDGLDDQNRDVRMAALNAMRPLADRALARIEERHRNRPFRAGQVTALQRLYERNSIARQGPLFQDSSKPGDPRAYAAFAESHSGDVERGRKIFNNVNGAACLKCHRVGKDGGEVGPDLSSVGLKYNRGQLIESMLYPSKQILDGYHQTLVVTKSEEEFSGIVRQETGEMLAVLDAEGKVHSIRKADIKVRKESQLSMMPEGLHLGLGLQDFADLSSYLESLKEEKPTTKP